MNTFKLDNRTLTLLKAQANLSETFSHTLRSTPRRKALPFRLKAERSQIETTFTVELGSERHTLTLPNGPKAHLKLADFIEEIANGPRDPVERPNLPHATRRYGEFEEEHRQRIFELVHTGGVTSLEMGFDVPLHVAIHRTRSRQGVTAILSIGAKCPRTKCFTTYGPETETYKKVSESILHLAAAATPAAHAA